MTEREDERNTNPPKMSEQAWRRGIESAREALRNGTTDDEQSQDDMAGRLL